MSSVSKTVPGTIWQKLLKSFRVLVPGTTLWVAVLLYTAFILWLSSAPRPIPGIRYFPWLDKVCHIIEFSPYGALWARALKNSFPRWSPWQLQWTTLLASLAVGGMDEFYQRFIPTRVSSLFDVAADGVGAFLGQRFSARAKMIQ